MSNETENTNLTNIAHKIRVDLFHLSEELDRYSSLDGTETGEVCREFSILAQNHPYLSDDFVIALHKEMTALLQDYRDHCRIVMDEEIQVIKSPRLLWEYEK